MDQRDIDDLNDRIRRLENREDRIVELVNTLEKAVDRISIILEQYQTLKIDERLRKVELELMNEKLVSKAVQWLGVSIGGTAILLIASYLFGNFK